MPNSWIFFFLTLTEINGATTNLSRVKYNEKWLYKEEATSASKQNEPGINTDSNRNPKYCTILPKFKQS